MTTFMVYLITRADTLKTVCGWGMGLAVLFFIAFVVGKMVALAEDEKAENHNFKDAYKQSALESAMAARAFCKAIKKYMILFGILGLFGCFVPTTKEVAAIYMIPKLAANEDVKQIPANLARLLNNKLEGWIDDIAPEVKKKAIKEVEKAVTK